MAESWQNLIDSTPDFLYTPENAFIISLLMPKSRPPTIAAVARHADVSIATVSRVLNGTTPVQPQKSDRVRQAMEQLQFVPRQAARVLASRRTNTIGLLLPEISGAFVPSMLKGVESGAHQAGYDLQIHSTQRVERILRRLGEHNTDGLLIFTNSQAPPELQHLHHIHFPVVLLYQTPPDSLDIPVIAIENKDGAAMLIDHLIENHCRRRIVYLRGPEGHEDSVWRELGFREALESHAIDFVPDLIASGGFDEDEAFAAVQRMLSDGLEFEAVFAGDDEAAVGTARALRTAGRLVPQDVAVVGFDDVLFARYFSPPLTTVRAPIEQVGREGVRQLVRLMDGEPAEALTLLRTELVIRESCGCHPPSTRAQDDLFTSSN